jgi:DNA-binding NarL/FixJ family response regulator
MNEPAFPAMGERPVRPYVLLLGQPGLAREVVEKVLLAAHVDLVDLVTVESAQDVPVVAVMIEGDHEDLWDDARRLGTPVVLVTHGELDTVGIVDAVLRGADAVVHLDNETEEVLEAIRVVAGGGTVLTPADARAVVESARIRLDDRATITLTRRECDILASIERGESVKQTARALGIAIKTVENLQSRLFRKLGARNRAQAIAKAHDLSLLVERAG